MHPDGPEHGAQDRPSPAVPVLAVLHLAGASLDAFALGLALIEHAVELSFDPAAIWLGAVMVVIL
jgi:hypothetical protein